MNILWYIYVFWVMYMLTYGHDHFRDGEYPIDLASQLAGN